MTHDALAALAALEHRYSGPIPEGLRLVARLGSAALADYLLAEGQVRFYREMAAGQLALIRRRRADGSFDPRLVADLRYYRGALRHWRRRRRALAALLPL
jgi:hypothetical protein